MISPKSPEPELESRPVYPTETQDDPLLQRHAVLDSTVNTTTPFIPSSASLATTRSVNMYPTLKFSCTIKFKCPIKMGELSLISCIVTLRVMLAV